MAEIWDDYVPTPQWATNRPVVIDGAQPTGTEFRVPLEDIYDRLEYLFDGNNVETLTRVYGVAEMVFDPTKWELNHAQGCVNQVNSNNEDYVLVPIRVPDGARITSISARVQPRAAHGASLPVEKPSFTLFRQNLVTAGTGTMEARGNQTDPSVTVVAYEVAHDITRNFSAPDELVNNALYAYWVRFEGESNTNAIDDLRFFGIRVTFITARRDGGAA